MTNLPFAMWFLVPVILWDRAMRSSRCEIHDAGRVQHELWWSEMSQESYKFSKVVKMSVHKTGGPSAGARLVNKTTIYERGTPYYVQQI
jgi:hypothetical protein